MKVSGTKFKAPPVKHEGEFEHKVKSLVMDLIVDEEEKYKIYFGAEIDGSPCLIGGKFDIDEMLEDDEETLDVGEWNGSVFKILDARKMIPTFIALVAPVCVARYEGDRETADFYAIYVMTWARHDVMLMQVDDVSEQEGQYALERFTDESNNGPLEEMAEIAREYVLRKG